MKQISVFHKGITTDLDFSKMDNQGLLLPTSNIRLLNIEGKGFVITPVKGNKKIFDLTPGFLVLGACEYNGIAYIASYNPNTNQGEIGSFPSPNNGVFEEVYRPLRNTTTGVPLRSTQFNFSLEYPIGDEMLAEIDYDDTVSLIFTDKKNDLRLVNTGFDQNGDYKPDRFYNINNIGILIKAIKDIPKQQRIKFIEENTGGQLKFGNYIMFYRYLDASNNKTEFVGESSPFTVTANSPSKPGIKISGEDESSGKRVTIEISNIDRNFSYIQIAFIRFSGVGGISVLSEVMLVDNFNAITSDTMLINITGFETIIPLDLSEITRPVSNETVCESILSNDRKIWGANWTGKEIMYEALRKAALKIKVSAKEGREIPNWRLRDFYALPENIKYAGYFRTEAYITGVVYVLNNGYETERFPVRGINARLMEVDEINENYSSMQSHVNQEGIIVMPSTRYSPALRNDEDNNTKGVILTLEFILDEFNDYIYESQEDQIFTQWIKDNVREIRFVRAERKRNLVYQGVVSNVFGKKKPVHASFNDYIFNSASIPSFDAILPSTENISGGYTGITYIEVDESDENIRAFYSPDFIFGNKNYLSSGEQPYLMSNYRFKYKNHVLLSRNIRPQTVSRENIEIITNLVSSSNVINTDIVHNQSDWITPSSKSSMGLVNRVDAVSEGQNETLFYKGNDHSNRGIIVPPYIGLKIEDSQKFTHETSSSFATFVSTVVASIYKFNPSDFNFLSLYSDSLNLNYFSISESIEIIKKVNSHICYQGDCFIQKVSIKNRTWIPTQYKEVGVDINKRMFLGPAIGDDTEDQRRIRYAHGETIEIATENENNLALRYGKQNETTFKEEYATIKVGPRDHTFDLWTPWWSIFPYDKNPIYGWEGEEGQNALSTGIESYIINTGNSKTLSIKPYLSFNSNIPKGNNSFQNRIRYSGVQEANYPPLAYRMWNYNHKEDFDSSDGAIKKIIIAFNRLISVQENSIMLHYINREEVIPTSSGELVVGTRSILSKEPTTLSKFGSQHAFAVIRAKSGVYGWDWMNGVMWRIIMNDEGSVIARSLNKENMTEGYIEELKNRVYGENQLSSNISRKIKDRIFTTTQEGLMLGYDKKQSEILFYFIKDGISEIMRFDENLSAFIGHYFYKPSMFVNLQSDTFAFPFNGHNNPLAKGKAFLLGAGNHCEFFLSPSKPVFSFIVNGFVGEDQNLFNLDKLYVAMEIESPDIEFIEKVEFKTLFQSGENSPLHNEVEFWKQPEYLMSKWAFPIDVAKEGAGQFNQNSNLQGKWLKVTVTLKSDVNILSKVFIKNIITKFITSNA